jgi:hypothetical protein
LPSASAAADDGASLSALDDWRRLPLDEAARVALAVERFPCEGIVIGAGPTEYLLLVGAHAVVILVDGDTLHVERVRRA